MLFWIYLLIITCHNLVTGISGNWTISKELEHSFLTDFQSHPLRQRETAIQWIKFLKNRKIVFIGDSLTRYQYLNLVHFLKSFQWNTHTPVSSSAATSDTDNHNFYPPVEMETYWNSWEDFLFGTNALLGCFEICTAYRYPSHGVPIRLHENRYYYHPGLNLSIDMFLYTPPHPLSIQLTVNVRMFWEYCRNHTFHTEIQKYLFFDANMSSRLFDIFTLLNEYIQPMSPDVLIVNQGLWAHPTLREKHTFNHLLTTMKNASQHAIWKTTTPKYRQNLHLPIDSTGFVDQIRASGVSIFDTFGLTASMSQLRVYWDLKHFLPFMYTELNIALLQQLHEMLV